MALIQINQKLLHITITLLIYGVRMEKVKCPEVCHCVETSVLVSANASKTEEASRKLDPYQRNADGGYKDDEITIGLNEIDEEEDDDSKTSKSNRLDDIFVRNFSTVSAGGVTVKNSKEIRSKRTLKLNESFSEAREEATFQGAKEFFTYQITCNQLLSPSQLPNPTTQLLIQRANFSSMSAFCRTLRESSSELSLLTDLSITNCVVDRENETKVLKKTHEFLPFASLQNPQTRTANDPPEPVSKLLLILNLSNNSLGFLPVNIFKSYPNLQTLDLSGNLIDELDDEVFSSLSNLLRLDLHGNRIATLNELVFKNLTKLLTLDLSNNSITNIAPSTFQYLTSLNTLILSDNPLSAKEQSMILLGTGKRLQIVDASKTGLKQIPGTLERSVQTLNLRGNYLSSIQCGDLDSYSLLTYLDLGGNKISYVEDDALGRLELLTNLQLSENSLFQIPKSLPNNLEILNLSYNNIQNVTNSDFLNLSLLKELSISYNQVSNIEENSFDNLSKLRSLDLSHNPILILPNMYGLVKLTDLNLSYFTNIPNRYSGRYEEFPAQAPENIRVLNLESSPLLTRTFLQDTKTLQSFSSLEELYLRFSNLTTLRKDLFGLLPRLRLLRVEGNPWHCEREILKLSEWLKWHQSATASEEDGVNTAHCATPPALHKKPLVSLTREDFGEDGGGREQGEIGKLHTGNASRNQMTLKRIQEVQSKSEIYFKSFQKPIDYGDDEEIEDLSNASRGAEIDFGGKMNLSAPGEDKETDVSAKLVSTEAANATSDNLTECCSEVNASTTAASAKSTAEEVFTVNAAALEHRSENESNATAESVSSTESSRGGVTKAEAMPVKDTSSSSALYPNANPRLMLATFVGAVILATTTVTILHVAKAWKDRSYKRETHDIEVHSISGLGSELW